MSIREREYHRLQAELGELDRLIAATPGEAVINRATLEYRKSQVEEEIRANPAPLRWPAHAHLTFNGKPVVDRQGIYAEFAGEAVEAFAKAVTSLAASQDTELGARGKIPNQDEHQLIVTGTAPGSFGFELEEIMDRHQQASLLAEESAVEVAIGQAKTILAALTGDEEGLADAIADTDNRALNDVRGFLRLMADSEAVCSLSFKNDTFRFRDVSQVKQGVATLESDNIQEGQETLHGYFQGFLPKPRRAQLTIAGSGEVLLCRVDQSVESAEEINENRYRPVDVRATSRRVGSSRPRYTIVGYDFSPDDPGEAARGL